MSTEKNYLTQQKDPIKKMQIEEAIHRLHSLRLHPYVERDFKSDGTLYLSERMPFGEVPCGVLLFLNDEEKDMVNKVETEYDIKVYHIIKTYLYTGVEYAMLYVGKDTQCYADERKFMTQGETFAYCKEQDDICSEFGLIGYQESAGGLIRTA